MNEIFKTIAASTFLTTVLIFLAKNWYLERIKNAIKYEYDRKIEALKIELKADADITVERLRANLQTNAARRKDFIDTVTSERVKWLEHLRQNVSKFAGKVHSFWHLNENFGGDPMAKQLLTEIDVLGYLIRLQLNPEEPVDKEIESLLREISTHAARSDFGPLQKDLEELVIQAQKLLKKEWIKVKQEAKHGELTGQSMLRT
jgi:hypothetical protein